MNKRLFCLLLGLLLYVATMATENVNNINGNYWLTMSRIEKQSFIDGFLNGLDLGYRFSIWQTMELREKISKEMDSLNVVKESLPKTATKKKQILDNEIDICFQYMGELQEVLDRGHLSYAHYLNIYTSNKTDTQFMAGLDDFYKDYRNRSIKITDAIWLVANEMSGRSRDTLDLMINNFRKYP